MQKLLVRAIKYHNAFIKNYLKNKPTFINGAFDLGSIIE